MQYPARQRAEAAHGCGSTAVLAGLGTGARAAAKTRIVHLTEDKDAEGYRLSSASTTGWVRARGTVKPSRVRYPGPLALAQGGCQHARDSDPASSPAATRLWMADESICWSAS